MFCHWEYDRISAIKSTEKKPRLWMYGQSSPYVLPFFQKGNTKINNKNLFYLTRKEGPLQRLLSRLEKGRSENVYINEQIYYSVARCFNSFKTHHDKICFLSESIYHNILIFEKWNYSKSFDNTNGVIFERGVTLECSISVKNCMAWFVTKSEMATLFA
jgi:hypothetical protein